MSVRAVDENGDKVYGGGLSSYKTGTDEIVQNIMTRLREIKNDCYWNMDGGLDIRGRVGQVAEMEFLKADVGYIVFTTPGVKNIISLSVIADSTKRKLTIPITVLLENKESINLFVDI